MRGPQMAVECSWVWDLVSTSYNKMVQTTQAHWYPCRPWIKLMRRTKQRLQGRPQVVLLVQPRMRLLQPGAGEPLLLMISRPPQES